MAPNKRASSCNEGDGDRDLQLPLCKRRAVLPDTRTASGCCSTNDIALLLEPALQKAFEHVISPMVEQVISTTLQRYLSSPCHGFSVKRPISPPAGAGRSLQLRLIKGLPSTIFTHINITAEDSSPLRIEVCDATIQNSKVTKGDGPSFKVQLCVLNGDFESEDWTAEEFKSNIESPRPGKGPLLKGDTVITIENGVGFFKNVEFTDNSCWTRCGKFRLGIRVLQSNSSPIADIKEARSEPIRVKDKRGMAHEKPDRPSLDHEVSHLRKIGKNGPICKQMFSYGIKTVKDLLRLHTTDQASMIQKICNIQGRCWEKIIEHAKSCEIDNDERYIYQYSTGIAEQPTTTSLVLNCIYEPVAISFDGQNFCSLESLDVESKRRVETIKRHAYKNLNDLKPFGQGHMVQAWAMPASYIGGGAQYVSEQVGCSSQQWEDYMSPLQVDQFLNYSLNSVGGDYGAKYKSGGNTLWAKLRNALKWTILYAANRKAKLLLHCHY